MRGKSDSDETRRPHRPRTAAQARELRRLRQRQRRRARILFFSVSFAFILLVSWPISLVIDHLSAKGETPSGSASSPVDSTAAGDPAPSGTGEQTPDSGVQTSGSDTAYGPVKSDEMTYAVPTAEMMALPENGRVDMSYFDNALFIGDSLTQGILTYKSATFDNASYAAYLGVGPKELISGTVTNINGESVTAMDEIRAANASKVYILLGTNSLVSYDDETLLHYYDEFLTLLETELPAGTTYYLQGIPPFSASKSAEGEEYSNERIRNLNDQIALLAYARGWHYLDLYGALADENGDQRPDYGASDGIHLNEAGYTAWREFLITHTAYDKDSPYIAGSPYLLA